MIIAKTLLSVLLCAFGVSFSAAYASTVALPVVGTVSPVPSNGSTPSGILEASLSSSSPPSDALSDSYQAEVFLDPTTHDLDFYYRVTDTGPNALSRISIVSFTSAITRVAYLTSGGISPNEADRDTAESVGFDFSGPGHLLPRGKTSDWIEIATNATHFTNGTLFIQDGALTTVDAFAPAPVAEPVSVALLGGGLAFLGIACLCRKQGPVSAISF